ncbi:MAG: hypothetical protein IJK66_04600 [Bacilli bacterium]|jgi:hypothetical protein|nr:hypothetical protein [Bacilli bacterium]
MKAATGELNLTLITVVALGAVLALFAAVIWPAIRDKVTTKINETDDVEVESGFNTNDVEFTKYIETELF